MKNRLPFTIFLVVLVSLTALWTLPASGKLSPPIKEIDCVLENYGTRIRYWLKNISFFSNTEETWDVPQADVVREIVSVRADQGILTWIAQYRKTGDSSLTYEVHYRIYDPGRGHWRAGSWGPLGPGSGVWLDQHQVKDGVVAWVAHRMVNNSYTMEHSVNYATYDPQFGSFVQDQIARQVSYFSKYTPGTLHVTNGVVAWPMNNANSGNTLNEKALDIFYTIYDQEIHSWQFISYSWSNPSAGFDYIKILNDTVVVDLQYSNWLGTHHDYMFYNPTTHKWDLLFDSDNNTAYGYAVKRRAFFVALPNVGFIPFTTCFWDCSYALDGVNTPSAWSWDMEGSYFSTDRSPVLNLPYLITFPGPFDRMDTVTQHVTYNDTGNIYTYTSQIREGTPPPPTGYININNEATYTNSANVTLSLDYEPSATEMCFRQAPGFYQWSNWETVAHSKALTLDTLTLLGASPDGPYTVYVKFRDQYLNESPEYSASITLVTTSPTALLLLNWGAATTTNRNVQVFCIAVSGYKPDELPLEMSACGYEIVDGWGWGVLLPWPTYWSWTPLYTVIPFGNPAWKKPVMVAMVQFKDIAGNITQAQAQIALKPPSLAHLLLLLGD